MFACAGMAVYIPLKYNLTWHLNCIKLSSSNLHFKLAPYNESPCSPASAGFPLRSNKLRGIVKLKLTLNGTDQ